MKHLSPFGEMFVEVIVEVIGGDPNYGFQKMNKFMENRFLKFLKFLDFKISFIKYGSFAQISKIRN